MSAADTQLRILASGILFRACLRHLGTATPQEKMALHQRVEEAAWALDAPTIAQLEGRDVDDGVPDAPAWRALVERLAGHPRRPD